MSVKTYSAIAAVAGLLIAAAQAQGEEAPHRAATGVTPAPERLDWSEWTRPFSNSSATRGPAPAAAPVAREQAELQADDVDVVDAHWMALTMWGEGRNQGEAGMRAVGHVIRNRWLARRHGAFVTDTVSAAYQFSCWNAGDPNRAAMLDIEDLRPSSADHRLWQDAKRIAAEILAGRSTDPTSGALFYHSVDVQPAWSRGLMPVAQIGSHLFFRTAA